LFVFPIPVQFNGHQQPACVHAKGNQVPLIRVETHLFQVFHIPQSNPVQEVEEKFQAVAVSLLAAFFNADAVIEKVKPRMMEKLLVSLNPPNFNSLNAN
jgi:hypothetical protein